MSALLLPLLALLIFGAGTGRAERAEADRLLREFLQPPPGCEMPCWIGIRPGETTIDHAVELLEAHPWIEHVSRDDTPLYTYVYWRWNGQQPDFAFNDSARMPAYLWANNNAQGIVQYIALPTRIPYADIWLMLGKPELGAYMVSDTRGAATLADRPNTRHVAAYFDSSVVVDSSVFCPTRSNAFWQAGVSITYYSASVFGGFRVRDYDLVNWVYRELPCRAW
jgi:hypothetical protein